MQFLKAELKDELRTHDAEKQEKKHSLRTVVQWLYAKSRHAMEVRAFRDRVAELDAEFLDKKPEDVLARLYQMTYSNTH